MAELQWSVVVLGPDRFGGTKRRAPSSSSTNSGIDPTIFAVCTSARRRSSNISHCPPTRAAPGCMVFFRQQVSQDDNLYIAMGHACLQQRDILHNRIVIAIAVIGLQGFEGRAPMVRHTPLRLIALRRVMARSTARLIK